MTTYNTGNPVPSTDVRDLYDNAENFDTAVNTQASRTWVDRLGVTRKTCFGIEQDFQDFLLSSGYQDIGDYGPGLIITARNQVFAKDGELWRAGPALALPYTTTGDWATEGPNFVSAGEGVLRQELSAPGGSQMVGHGSESVKSALDALEASDVGSVVRFGAVGDGVSESGVALVNALAASPTVVFPRTDAGYRLQDSRTITLTRDSEIDFAGNQITFGDTARITITSPVGVSGRTLTELVQVGSAAVQLNSVAGIEIGDLLYIETTIAPSTEWADTKKDCVRVKGFFGANYVLLEEGLNFAYDPSDAGLQISTYKPKRLTLRNPHLVMSSDATPRLLIEVRGCQDIILENPVITGPAPFNTASNVYRVGVVFYRCFGGIVTNGVFTRMSYPVELDGGTRNVRATNILANACHHTVEAADWSSGLHVDGLDASDCYSAVSAHPSFNVHFSNLSCRRETGLANIRTFGGSLSNGYIETLADDTAELPQFQSMLMKPEYLYLYDTADFDANRVTWRAPARTVRPCFAVNFGRTVRVSNLTMPVMGMSLTSFGNIKNLEIGPGMRVGAANAPGKAWLQNAARSTRPPLIAPRTIGGIPTILLPFEIADSVGGYAQLRGPILIGSTTSPATTSFIIYLDTFPEFASADEIVGELTLLGTVRHNAAGRFSTRKKTWNFISSRTSPGSNSLFPLTPTFQSVTSGQPSDVLTLDISSASFGTSSDGYQYVQINTQMTATGLSGLSFGLSYELNLHRLI